MGADAALSPPGLRGLAAAGLLGLALSAVGQPLPAAPPASGPGAEAGPPACRFRPPRELPAGAQLSWSGACAAGRAQGLGVLRARGAGGRLDLFLGTMAGGEAALGVVERPGEGWVAGRFVQGRRIDDGDRNTLLDAFAQARAAAQAEAARQRQAGRPASARVKAQKARQLADALD